MLLLQTYVGGLPRFRHCQNSVSATGQGLFVSFYNTWMWDGTRILLYLLDFKPKRHKRSEQLSPFFLWQILQQFRRNWAFVQQLRSIER